MTRGLLSLAVAALVLSPGCEGGSAPGLCPYAFTGAVDSNFGDPRIDSMLEATGHFVVAADELDTTVRGACNSIATDLGAAMAADTQTACDNAAMAIDDALMTNASVTLTVSYVPAVCTASFDAVAACAAECDASFDAMATPPRCEGGELSGTCSGMCTGSCTVEGDVACEGSCQGSCSGTCDVEMTGTCTGTCMGQCDGTCMTTATDGSCAGECMGTCSGRCDGTIEGTCSGSCSGSCMGSCRADVTAMCDGTCTGMCDVMFTEPRCEGGELTVDAEAECKASCEADASFDLMCTDPELVITFAGMADDPAQLTALIDTLHANLPTILVSLRKARAFAAATVDLADQLPGAASAAAGISVQAADCVARAVDAQIAAAAKVQVSVEVSVEVSASASASTG